MKTTAKKNNNIKNLSLSEKAELALNVAVAKTIAEHKLNGRPIAVWQKGKAVWIPPEEIIIPHR